MREMKGEKEEKTEEKKHGKEGKGWKMENSRIPSKMPKPIQKHPTQKGPYPVSLSSSPPLTFPTPFFLRKERTASV